MKEFGTQIYKAVRSGALQQPFRAGMIKKACPGWANRTYHTFLGKHAVGNGTTSELFERVGYGLYRIKEPRVATA